MSIELCYFDDCPSYRQALDNLLEAMRLENVDEKVCLVRVASEEDAQVKRLIGSPTIRIGGVDLEGAEADQRGYAVGCRVYVENGGMAGWPAVETIRKALAGLDRNGPESSCRLLFDTELQYRPGAEAVTSAEGRQGKRLGGGDGIVRGIGIEGTVLWDIYEEIGSDRCETNLLGSIKTNDGAVVDFETRGYGVVPDASQPNHWAMSAAVRLQSSDERYSWVNSLSSAWTGEFDMNTGRHRYRAFAGEQGGSHPKSAEVEYAACCCG